MHSQILIKIYPTQSRTHKLRKPPSIWRLNSHFTDKFSILIETLSLQGHYITYFRRKQFQGKVWHKIRSQNTSSTWQTWFTLIFFVRRTNTCLAKTFITFTDFLIIHCSLLILTSSSKVCSCSSPVQSSLFGKICVKKYTKDGND